MECVRDGCMMDSGNGTPIPVNGLQYDYGNGDLDVRQRFTVMLNYALPFGKSLHGAAAYLVKGWGVNTIYAYSTGLPTSISEPGGGPPGTITNASGILGFRGGDTPNRVGDANAGNIHTNQRVVQYLGFCRASTGAAGQCAPQLHLRPTAEIPERFAHQGLPHPGDGKAAVPGGVL